MVWRQDALAQFFNLGKRGIAAVPAGNKRTYPKIAYRWVADALPGEEAAFNAGSLALFAVERNLLRPEHARPFGIAVRHFINRAAINPESAIHPRGTPNDTWPATTWKKVLYQNSPAYPKPLKYRFLIERALDGEHHHASSLSWLITYQDLIDYGFTAPNLATARYWARLALARLRKRITVEPDGTRGIQSERCKPTVQYPSFDASKWKSAAGVPGYYGLHVPESLGPPTEAPPSEEKKLRKGPEAS